MSDIGVFPPGAMVWLAALLWCVLCLLALTIFLIIAWRRARAGSNSFARDRFVGYAIGVWFSGVVAGLTMSLINWSGSLGAFSRWVDKTAAGLFWLGLIVVSAPIATTAWNALRRRRQNASD